MKCIPDLLYLPKITEKCSSTTQSSETLFSLSIPIGTVVALAWNQLLARSSRNSIECAGLLIERGTALASGDKWLALDVKFIDESKVSQGKIDFFCKISLIPS